MKRIIAAIAVLLSVMCFAYAYRLQVLGMIQTDVVAVSDRNLAKTLQKGADGDKEPDPVTLEKFRAGDTVYRRGNNLYLGPKKERIQGEYPFYTGDGTGIWYFQATGSLMTDDFMEYEPYAGLFVSDGTAFDDEGVGQDEDTYIFAKLNNGLYMNTVPITIRSNGLDHALRLGSLICFREDDLSAYGYAGERLVYSDLKNLGSAKVVIRDNTYDYHSFVRLIGAVHAPSEPAARDEKPEETMAAEEGMRQRYFFLDVHCRGHYPSYALKEFERKGYDIGMQEGDAEILAKGTVDYIGFSYYMSTTVKSDVKNDNTGDIVNGALPNGVENPYIESSDWGWAIDPVGLRYTLNRFYDRYELPMFIVENGFGAIDIVDENNEIHDEYRIDYLRKHIEQMKIAVNYDGVELMGYTPWGIMDLVSFTTGEMKKRYGMIYVDRDNEGNGSMERLRKDSYFRYKNVIASQGENLESVKLKVECIA